MSKERALAVRLSRHAISGHVAFRTSCLSVHFQSAQVLKYKALKRKPIKFSK